MSYASETKNELARIEPEKKCCMLAEIAGFMRFAGSVGLAGGLFANLAPARLLPFSVARRNADDRPLRYYGDDSADAQFRRLLKRPVPPLTFRYAGEERCLKARGLESPAERGLRGDERLVCDRPFVGANRTAAVEKFYLFAVLRTQYLQMACVFLSQNCAVQVKGCGFYKQPMHGWGILYHIFNCFGG